MRTRKHIIEVPLPERAPRRIAIEAPDIFQPKKQPAKNPQEVERVPNQQPLRVPTGNEGYSVGLQDE